MEKKYMYLILIGILILFVSGMYLQKKLPIFSTITVTKMCSEATTNNIYGAQQGQCILVYEDNKPRVAYVNSVFQKTSPSGTITSCQIDTCTSCFDKIFTCNLAKGPNGDVKVCKYDTDCNSGDICINMMCRQGNDCNGAAARCINNVAYQTCLSSNKFSGTLYCQTGTHCYNGQCLTDQAITQLNAPYETCQTGEVYNEAKAMCEDTTSSNSSLNNNPGPTGPEPAPSNSNQTLIIVGGGIGVLGLLYLLGKKK